MSDDQQHNVDPITTREQIDAKIARAVSNAVSREVRTQINEAVAPLRDQMQTQLGMSKQFNSDVIGFDLRLKNLEIVVKGDSTLNVAGLMAQVTKLDATLKQLTEQLEDVKHYWVIIKWVFGILLALGVLDNATVAAVIKAILS